MVCFLFLHIIPRLTLTIEDAGAKDRGTYTCEATKGGVAATGDFTVSVHIPAICTHEDGASFLQGEIYNPNQVCSVLIL